MNSVRDEGYIIRYVFRCFDNGENEWERVRLSKLRLGCITTRFSAHCYSSSCWRLCLVNSGKAYGIALCGWSCTDWGNKRIITVTEEGEAMKGVDGKEGNESECWKDKAYMWCQVSMGQVEDFEKNPCGVCRKGVGNNSILSIECVGWVHERYRSFSGRLNRTVDFYCRRCLDGIM